MADNVAITAGSGTNIATDDVGGAHYQRVKLALGADGAAADAAVGGGTEATALRVTVASDSTGAVGVSSVTPGTGATSLGKAEDAAHSSGDTGVMLLAVRKDSAGSLAGADGDYIPLTTDSNGLLRVTTAASGGVAGDVAHDTADSGNPVKVGYKAMTTNPTAVADADRVNGMADPVGRALVRIGQTRALVTQAYVQVANTSETTILAAGGASVFHDLLHLTLSNQSTSLTTTVTIRDTTAGGTIFSITLGPRGLWSGSFPAPFKQTTANTNWTAQQTSTVNLDITIQAEKNVA